jgi:hypothetical protein
MVGFQRLDGHDPSCVTASAASVHLECDAVGFQRGDGRWQVTHAVDAHPESDIPSAS